MAISILFAFMFLASITGNISSLEQVESQPTCILEQLGQADMTLMQQGQKLSLSLQELTSENFALNATIQLLKTEGQQLAASVAELENENQQISDKISALESGHQGSRLQSAFSAYMTVGYVEPNNSTNIVLPLNGVNFNVNDDYNADTSTYTCPVDGVYYFSYAVYSSGIQESQDDRLYAFLAVNGNLQNEAYCNTDTDVKIYCQSTNADTVHCNQGDIVQVKTRSSSGKNQIYGTSKYKRTTFTGHLVYAD